MQRLTSAPIHHEMELLTTRMNYQEEPAARGKSLEELSQDSNDIVEDCPYDGYHGHQNYCATHASGGAREHHPSHRFVCAKKCSRFTLVPVHASKLNHPRGTKKNLKRSCHSGSGLAGRHEIQDGISWARVLSRNCCACEEERPTCYVCWEM